MFKAVFTLLVLALSVSVAESYECNVCHSKNPAMVRMHEAVRGNGCFGCHKVGERLMGRGQPKDKASLLKRRTVDENCTACHVTKDTKS